MQGSLPSEDAAVMLLFSLVAAGKSGCGELTSGRRSPPCSGSRPREPHEEAASPQLSPCFGFESGGEDPGATLHGLARYQGTALRVVAP